MPARNNINASLPSQESISSCPIPLLCFACACLRFHVHGDALISHEKGSAMPWTFECHYIYIKDIKRYQKIDIDSKLRSSSAFIWRFALSPRSSSVLRALDMKALHKKVWAYLPEGKLLQVTRLQERGYLQIKKHHCCPETIALRLVSCSSTHPQNVWGGLQMRAKNVYVSHSYSDIASNINHREGRRAYPTHCKLLYNGWPTLQIHLDLGIFGVLDSGGPALWVLQDSDPTTFSSVLASYLSNSSCFQTIFTVSKRKFYSCSDCQDLFCSSAILASTCTYSIPISRPTERNDTICKSQQEVSWKKSYSDQMQYHHPRASKEPLRLWTS